jgi:hypothetical protein
MIEKKIHTFEDSVREVREANERAEEYSQNAAKILREKYEHDRKELQDSCSHPKTEWMDYSWAPGHIAGKVRVCTRCEKIIEKSWQEEDLTW